MVGLGAGGTKGVGGADATRGASARRTAARDETPDTTWRAADRRSATERSYGIRKCSFPDVSRPDAWPGRVEACVGRLAAGTPLHRTAGDQQQFAVNWPILA